MGRKVSAQILDAHQFRSVVYGLDLDSYQTHARCILLDTKTGYRSQFLAVSGIIVL